MKKKELKSKVYIVTEMTDTSKSQEPAGTANERPEKARMPNPALPYDEYLLACHYCENYVNMTRSDWMEMAVVEKLHNDGLLSDARFYERMQEIKNRPPRGRRKYKNAE